MADDTKTALFWALKCLLVRLWHHGSDDAEYQRDSLAVKRLQATVKDSVPLPASVRNHYFTREWVCDTDSAMTLSDMSPEDVGRMAFIAIPPPS